MAYKILAVGSQGKNAPKYWTGKGGEMVDWKVKFQGYDEIVAITRKVTSPAPQVGDELDGTIDQTQYGPKFKQAYEQRGGGGGGSRRSESSEAAIVAQSSMKLAVKLLSIGAIEMPPLDEVEALSTDLMAMVERLAAGKTNAQPAPSQAALNEFTGSESVGFDDLPNDLPEGF